MWVALREQRKGVIISAHILEGMQACEGMTAYESILVLALKNLNLISDLENYEIIYFYVTKLAHR